LKWKMPKEISADDADGRTLPKGRRPSVRVSVRRGRLFYDAQFALCGRYGVRIPGDTDSDSDEIGGTTTPDGARFTRSSIR